MADSFAIAEESMSTAVASKTTLILKADVHIRPNPAAPHCLLVGSLSIPGKVIAVTKNPSELNLKAPWIMLPGEQCIPGLGGLQRCIRPSPEWEHSLYYSPGECYYISSSLIVGERRG